jgi:hypothetical protein
MSGMRAMVNGAIPVTRCGCWLVCAEIRRLTAVVSALLHSGLTETVEGFDMGRGGSVLFSADGGAEALANWAAAAVDALKWSQSSSSSVSRFRERMMDTAKRRFLDDAVVAK